MPESEFLKERRKRKGQRLLPKSQRLLRYLRAYINHDNKAFPSIDQPVREQEIREALLKRVAQIIRED
jgi:hypothetical protein